MFNFQAAQQQKFREIQEVERRKRMEEQRARDHDKFVQVEERRRAIESAERGRREALLKKNQEREGKIFAKKKAQNSQTYFAFGSCTPRMGYSVSGKLVICSKKSLNSNENFIQITGCLAFL